MAITRTPNLNLGRQLDKKDYVNWDVIQDNWMRIDDAVGGSGNRANDSTVILDGIRRGFVAQAQEVE